jgi:hypothetical protein
MEKAEGRGQRAEMPENGKPENGKRKNTAAGHNPEGVNC